LLVGSATEVSAAGVDGAGVGRAALGAGVGRAALGVGVGRAAPGVGVAAGRCALTDEAIATTITAQIGSR